MKVILFLIICEFFYLVITNEASFCETERKVFLRVNERRDSLLLAKLELFFQHTRWIIKTVIHM